MKKDMKTKAEVKQLLLSYLRHGTKDYQDFGYETPKAFQFGALSYIKYNKEIYDTLKYYLTKTDTAILNKVDILRKKLVINDFNILCLANELGLPTAKSLLDFTDNHIADKCLFDNLWNKWVELVLMYNQPYISAGINFKNFECTHSQYEDYLKLYKESYPEIYKSVLDRESKMARDNTIATLPKKGADKDSLVSNMKIETTTSYDADKVVPQLIKLALRNNELVPANSIVTYISNGVECKDFVMWLNPTIVHQKDGQHVRFHLLCRRMDPNGSFYKKNILIAPSDFIRAEKARG